MGLDDKDLDSSVENNRDEVGLVSGIVVGFVRDLGK